MGEYGCTSKNQQPHAYSRSANWHTVEEEAGSIVYIYRKADAEYTISKRDGVPSILAAVGETRQAFCTTPENELAIQSYNATSLGGSTSITQENNLLKQSSFKEARDTAPEDARKIIDEILSAK
ncbi:MAG: hypothetical protein HGA67_00955 [Candidatus Yonathbacteria bacterium]|nr:hypothetical protein [Candidatus Yonathbacteria bacterium]